MVEGIYLHIPFCSLKCPYCDFTSITVNNKQIFTEYVSLVLKELHMYRDLEFDVKTVYFGGGTPSLLPPEVIAHLIEGIDRIVGINGNAEVTVEVNPENYRYLQFKQLKQSGVNRISVGVQSFQLKQLRALGREHSPEDSLKTVEDAFRAGIENISIDLIYGIQGQDVESLEKDLKTVENLPVKHLSAYMLTAYEETPLGQMVKRGEYFLPDDDTVYRMFLLIDSYLNRCGFSRYEISNWAKEGYQCRHNLLYWKRKEFLGLGVSAWSFANRKRFGNTKNLHVYMEKVKKGEFPVEFVDLIDDKEEKKEKIFLGLRLKNGIDIKLVKDKMNFLRNLEREGFIEIKGEKVSLTPKGIFVSSYISSQLI
ncbi:radical SAM family heme chaperone HemW [Persephonella atlantica]|uniref:Heme chaperone HemW n=1 Tax=Persephonella atlantica TaxID=2699429 RepID=A0ABS1GIQ6_9AQUI|nr:radical SAM family heme chaperone HemW [Persephonella atlantica]MBK3332730.1 radical SAM family heme chaperone HemW [Persephonella atlantica]